MATDPDNSGLDGPFPGLGYGLPVSKRTFASISNQGMQSVQAAVAEEIPVAFVYQQRPYAVMMATPADLEDLAIGFTLSERIVDDLDEIESVSVFQHSRGIDL